MLQQAQPLAQTWEKQVHRSLAQPHLARLAHADHHATIKLFSKTHEKRSGSAVTASGVITVVQHQKAVCSTVSGRTCRHAAVSRCLSEAVTIVDDYCKDAVPSNPLMYTSPDVKLHGMQPTGTEEAT